MLQVGLQVGLEIGLRVGFNSEHGSFPSTLAQLNAVFSAYGASFSHAWNLDEASGNAADLASSGTIPLLPAGAPVQGEVTGLLAGDKGVRTIDGGSDRMAPAANASLDVTTGSVIMLATVRFPSVPAGLRMAFGKRVPGGNHYECRMAANGKPLVSITDGTNNPQAAIDVDHTGTAYHDLLIVLDRVSATKLLTFTSDLGDSGSVSVTTLGTITTASTFGLGGTPAASFFSTPAIFTFFAWGTVPGTLVANRAAAVTAWRGARGA